MSLSHCFFFPLEQVCGWPLRTFWLNLTCRTAVNSVVKLFMCKHHSTYYKRTMTSMTYIDFLFIYIFFDRTRNSSGNLLNLSIQNCIIESTVRLSNFQWAAGVPCRNVWEQRTKNWITRAHRLHLRDQNHLWFLN